MVSWPGIDAGACTHFPLCSNQGELAPSQERPWREQRRQWAILSGQGVWLGRHLSLSLFF